MMTFAPLRAPALLIALMLMPAVAQGENLIHGGTFKTSKGAFWSSDTIKLSPRNGQLCADVPGGIANPWDALVGIDRLPLDKESHYRLSFDARATGHDAPDTVRVLIQQAKEPWTAHMTLVVEPVESMQTFGQTFAALASEPAQLVFQLGGQAGSWRFCIDNVALMPDDGTFKADAAMKQAKAQAQAMETIDDPIRLNQLGFFEDGPKRATILSLSKAPLHFQLKAANGAVLGEGETEPRPTDPTSGYPVHVADFSALTIPGTGYRLEVEGKESHPFAIGADGYQRLAVDALSWFYPQRSGIAIDGAIAGAAYARPAGHVGQAPNRGDTAVRCLTGDVASTLYGDDWQCSGERDVSGGWYDAGDHGKYVVNGGIAAAQLMASFEWATVYGAKDAALLQDGYARIPEHGNGVPDILDEVRWELEFLVKMIVPDGEPYAGMAYHKVHDIAWTDLPTLPHLDPQARVLHRPSTAATLNVAATAAQGARLFKPYDPDFAGRLLDIARSTYAAARQTPDLYAPSSDGQQGGGDYSDTDVSDEFYWAAAELFITTGDAAYVKDLHASPHWDAPVFDANGFTWQSVAAFARLQLGLFAEALPGKDIDMIRRSIVDAADDYRVLQRREAFGHVYRPKGDLYGWGSNHLALQNLLVLAAAHDLTGERSYLQAVREGVDYILGRNALDLSYITGYGTVFSRNQHSRWYAHQLDASLPSPPAGSLAGGPNATLVDPVAKEKLKGCIGQTCYIDDIGSWGTNEITINWNAALVQVTSFLSEAR